MKRNYLATLRRERSWSKAEMAQRMNLSRQYYSFIEDGTRQVDMSLSIANGLSKVLRISLNKINEYEQTWKNESEVEGYAQD